MATTHNPVGRILLVPLPLQGHLTPLLQLAALLRRRGFSITIVHPRFNSPSPANFPDFHFELINDGLSAGEAASDVGNVATLINAMNENCVAPFRECVEKLVGEGSAPIRCVVSDAAMHFTLGVASALKIPRIALRTSSVTSFLASIEFVFNRRCPSSMEDANGALQSLREQDIPLIEMAKADELHELLENVINKTKASTGAIWNSFEELEEESLAKLRAEFGIPIFPVGPLHKTLINSSTSLIVQDQRCMDWLHKQPPKSVIYVSFGSIASFGKQELVETAWGLARSRQPFLWVMRKNLTGSETVELPDGFVEETMDRGMIVEWAPQLEVLAHEAVGGFWTHCGWNSTLEGICEGVPFLCTPCYGDQKVNARYVSHVWRVGIQLDGFERGEIERAVRKLMVEKEGKEIKERIKALKESAEQSFREGGSSCQNLYRLVDWIATF